MTPVTNQRVRRRVLNAAGMGGNLTSRNKFAGAKTYLAKHLPTLLERQLLRNGKRPGNARSRAYNAARAFQPTLNAAQSELNLLRRVQATQARQSFNGDLLRSVLLPYATTTGLAWKRMGRNLGTLNAARLLSSRAKAALASPHTALGRRRLLREFGNLSI